MASDSSRFGHTRVSSSQQLSRRTVHPSQLQLQLTPQQQRQCQYSHDNDTRPNLDAFASFIDDHWSLYDFEYADLPTFDVDVLSGGQTAPKMVQHHLDCPQQVSANWDDPTAVAVDGPTAYTSQSFAASAVPLDAELLAIQDDPVAVDITSDVESDQSWDEDGGWAAFRAILKKQLQDFAADKTKTSLPINPLPKNQRVIVHTIADTYGFSHRSHGHGKMRSMTIYKASSWENPFTPAAAADDGNNSSTKLFCQTCSSPQSGPLRRNSSYSSSLMPRTFSGNTLASLAESSSFDFSLDTSMTNASTVATSFPPSDTTSNASKKRRRNPKIVGGYHCGSCDKAFDRECERVKHEKYHLEDEQRPHRCEFCPKGYLLLKDLRNHLDKAHDVRTPKFFF